MSGHTAGPWRSNDNYVIRSQDGFGPSVCVLSTGTIEGPFSDDTIAANARLITSAPDLLAALHLAAEALDAYSDVNDGEDGPTPNRAMSALEDVEAAIAKAEGKPPTSRFAAVAKAEGKPR